MNLNEGSALVPMALANEMLAPYVPGAELPYDEYERIQLLTDEGYKDLLFSTVHKLFKDAWFVLSYGMNAKDFPLCADFAKILVGLICLAGAMVGLSTRSYFFRLHYTKNEIDPKTGKPKRHAINGVLCADGSVKFLESETLEWIDKPKDLKKYDRVRL